MSTLERAIVIAAEAHAGVVDKAGQPYILHPLRVMLRLSTLEERIAAVLHDVLEDTGVTCEELRREGFSEGVIEALESVTKRAGEDYETFVRRAAANPVGRNVKLADLADNSDRSRLPNPTLEDEARFAKYERAMNAIRRYPE
jgi:(p)ppGpp synthase/HD superfamily hydrolase